MGTKTETATFAIALEDQTSGPAGTAARSLEALKARLDADTKALREMQAAMGKLKGGTSTNVAAFKQLRDQIAAQREKVAQAQSAYVELGGTFGATAPSLERTSGMFDALLGSAKRLPGPLGGIAAKLEGLLAGGSVAAGLLGIAAAFGAIAIGVGAATAALLRYGVAQSDARRNELLRLEGLQLLRRRHGDVAAGATAMQEAIDRVSDSTTLGRNELEGYSNRLYRMGLRGNALSTALEGVAITASTLGSGRADMFAGLVAGANRSGRSVQKLVDAVKGRLGPLAERQMLSLDVQSQKLHDRIARIFDGLKIEGLLRVVNVITSAFSQNAATGRALKAIVDVLFQPLVDQLANGGPLAKRFFQGLVLGAQTLTILILKVALAFKRTFGGSDLLANVDTLKIALWGGVAVFSALVGAVGAVVVVLGVAAAAVGFLVVSFAALMAVPAAVIYGFKKLFDLFQEVDWSGLGSAIVNGLVRGVLRGRDAVIGAIRRLAFDAETTLSSALDIHSPSRVFAELGRQIPRGLAVGVQAEAGSAERAVGSVVPIPSGSTPGGRSTSVSIGEIHVHASSSEPNELANAIRDQLVRVFEGLTIEMGAPA